MNNRDLLSGPFSGPPSWLATICLLLLAMSWSVSAAAVTSATKVLTNAVQVRALTTKEAASAMPVRLRGYVLHTSGESMVLLDDSAGVYVEAEEALDNLSVGEMVELRGVVDPGAFAPYVKLQSLVRLGVGTLPAPQAVSFDELESGRMDAQWVQVRGIVRQIVMATESSSWSGISLAMAGGIVLVKIPSPKLEALRVDSEIQLRVICFYQFNKARQAINPLLELPQGESIQVVSPAPTNPFAVPARSISSLMQFNLSDAQGRRVRVQGVVTLVETAQGFWMEDEQHGLQVKGGQQGKIEVGALVNVLGFLKRGPYSPMLEDAVCEVIDGPLKQPQPERLRSIVQAYDYDARLVSVEARLQEYWPAGNGWHLALVDSTNRFLATLPLTAKAPFQPRWLPGSRVRVAGICIVQPSKDSKATGTIEPESFELLMRSPDDLEVLVAPPWWNSRRVAWMLAVVLGGLLCYVGIIVWISRNRLRQQAIEREKAEAEFSAVWNERNRLARELHDTLAQGLGAISMQLELTKRKLPLSSAAREPLEEARSLARSNMAEARNAIWNMRSQVLETGDLANALEGILHSLTNLTGTVGTAEVRGSVRRLAPFTENNLLRIGQEAITNAVRHAGARRIQLVVEFKEGQVLIAVTDDGKGFNPKCPPPGSGGLGLVGMRERVEELHGSLEVTSKPGEGTVVTVSVPLHAAIVERGRENTSRRKQDSE